MLTADLRKWRWSKIDADTVKVKCPYCGYEMPISYDPDAAKCTGVYVKCKGRNCKKEFEIKINTK